MPVKPLPATLASTTLPTPDHSVMLTATIFDAESVTVTPVIGGAPSRYQISIRLLAPLRKPTGPLVQATPVESTTVATLAELPAASAIDATMASPARVNGTATPSEAAVPETTVC